MDEVLDFILQLDAIINVISVVTVEPTVSILIMRTQWDLHQWGPPHIFFLLILHKDLRSRSYKKSIAVILAWAPQSHCRLSLRRVPIGSSLTRTSLILVLLRSSSILFIMSSSDSFFSIDVFLCPDEELKK